jgi:hypothetical protein
MSVVHRLAPVLVVLLGAFSSLAQSPLQTVGSNPGQISTRLQNLEIPLAFETNQGQGPESVDFVARGQGYSAQFRADRLALVLNRSDGEFSAESVVEIAFAGASRNAKAAAGDQLAGRSNYLLGSDPAHWITNVGHYAKVRYGNVYPGIDLVFHGHQNHLEHDFIIRPGTSPDQIGLSFSGVRRTELETDGDLVLQTKSGEMRLRKPRAYQIVDAREVEVPVKYVLREGLVGFNTGRYDRHRALVIDPVLVYSTFFGGTPGPDGLHALITAMAVDGSGNLYVAGSSDSTSFPVTTGVVDPNPGPSFISKLDPTGTSSIFSTYIQGIGIDALAVDAQGNVYVAGGGQKGLPIPPGSNPYQPDVKGVALLKLNPTGTAVLNATYFGGSGVDTVGGLAIDSADDVYLAGSTSSNDFPLQNPLQSTLGTSGASGFVTEFNPALSALIYSTYLGANSSVTMQGPEGLALDSQGDAYVAGTANPGFPTTTGAYQMTCPDDCTFLAELNPAGSALLNASYLGSGSDSAASAVAVDSAGNAYLAGTTLSASFPVLNPIQPCSIINGTTNYVANFLAEFSQAGSLLFSTCLGTIGSDSFALIALTLDSLGNAYLAGNAASGIPLQSPIDANPPLESGGQPGGRPFVSEIDHSTHALLFSSFVGQQISFDGDGTGDQILALVVDSSGNIYLAGESGGGYLESPFPVFNAIQSYLPVYGGCPGLHDGFDCFFVDGFITKISPDAGAAAATSPGGLYLFGPSDALVELVGSTSPAQVVTVYDLGTNPFTVSSIAISGDFAVASNNCTTVSPAGGSCAIGVTFTPTQVGTLTGTLTITDNSAGSPHTVQLFGVGGQLSVVPSPSTVSFASQLIGTSTAQNVTLTNPSAFNVQITKIQVTGDFTEVNDCQSLMLPSYVCTVDVTFTPTATGTRTGTLTITDNAPNSPQTVTLTGIGAPPGLGLGIASGGSNSATVADGATATYPLTGMSGTVSLSCTGAPAGSTCTVPATETITATATTPFKVTVTTASGAKAVLQPMRLAPPRWLWAFALMGLVLLPAGAKRPVRRCLLWLPLSLIILLCCSCGGSSNSGGSSSGGTPAGTYTLTVIGTMGSASQAIPLTLVVQ